MASKSKLTGPQHFGQQKQLALVERDSAAGRVIAAAYADGDVEGALVEYVEAHTRFQALVALEPRFVAEGAQIQKAARLAQRESRSGSCRRVSRLPSSRG